MNPRGWTKRPFNIGYSAASPIVVFVSSYSRAWGDGSNGRYPETPVVVVASRHASAWLAGSDSCFFEILIVVVVYFCARAWRDSSRGFVSARGGCDGIMLLLETRAVAPRAGGLLVKDVRASSVWWASVVLVTKEIARRAGNEGVGAHCAGDDGVAGGLLVKDVCASSVWWASVVLVTKEIARRAGNEGVGAHRAGDNGVLTCRSGDEGVIVVLATKMAAIVITLVRVGGCHS